MRPPVKFADIAPETHVVNYHAVKPGKEWGPRVIPDYELILAVSGAFSYRAEACGKLEQREGTVLCIPPGALHTYRCERASAGKAVISCIHFEFIAGRRRLDGDYAPEIEPPLLTDVSGDAALHSLFKNASDAFNGFGSRRQDILRCAVKEIVLRLAEHWEGRGGGAMSPRMKRMTSFISSRLSGKSGRRELAEAFGLSPERVNALFRKELGMSPTEYLHRARVSKAYLYLREDGLSVKETAAELGFSDEFHFSKIFKRYMGLPPSRVVAPRAANSALSGEKMKGRKNPAA